MCTPKGSSVIQLPCVQMDEVVEGVVGPNTVDSCGQIGRVLHLSASYVVGVGDACSPFSEWTDSRNYTREELLLLRGLADGTISPTIGGAIVGGAVTNLPSTIAWTISIAIVIHL